MSNVTEFWAASHISSNFGDARESGRKHRGTDYTHGNGTPIPSPLAGTVTATLAPAPTHGFGYQVTVQANSGEVYSFAHMQSASLLGVGANVSVGQILGYEGRTGATTGPCVHVEYNNNYRGFSDPAPHIAALINGTVVAGSGGPTGNGFSKDTQNRQNWLLVLGIRVGPTGADGIEGPNTRSAYKVYQEDLRAHWGYTGAIDGIWGAGTQAAHQRKYDSMHPVVPAFPLPAGSYFGPRSGPVTSVSGYFNHRESLRMWQQQMKNRGWPITPDGRYGTQTHDVAEAFQAEKHLTVDGLIGPATWSAAWTAPVT